MRRLALVLGIATIVCAPPALAAQDADAIRLLEQSDRFRGDWPSMQLKVRIDNYDGARLTESADFDVAVKGENSLITFRSPKNKGQVLLMRGDDMWLYLPDVARGVRITPMQRLVGNTSNGDLARLRYAIDYSAVMAGEEDVNGTRCVVLDLTARRKSAAYQRVRYLVRKGDALPIKAEYFFESGRPFKTASFEELKVFADRLTISRLVILDAIKRDSKTIMTFDRFTPQPIDDRVFNVTRAGS
jgi:outer membrane lipoprotein-sorting protein